MYLVRNLLIGFLPITLHAFWRLPCYSPLGIFRIDPIVSKGKPSQHAHTLHGAQNLSFSSTYDDLTLSNCTSCAVLEDKSAYWTPSLMFFHDNGTVEMVPQVGGMLVYYLLFGQNITAFPKGFEMVAGDASRRNDSVIVSNSSRTFQGAQNKSQTVLTQQALGFNCLNYKGTAEGALERHVLPDKMYIDSACIDGLRLELMFPSCWDGVHVNAPNHKSHVAYPDPVMDGVCPENYPFRIPSLYFETIWDTFVFRNLDGSFLLSNGDCTGYSYHGDFQNGWDIEVLQRAIENCTSPTGLVEQCSVFTLQSLSEANECKISPPGILMDDNCAGPRLGLCGNITI